jgi:hypothetical protein
MSPTVLIYKQYRFFFFSREEQRKHVHVQTDQGEAKFWLEPDIEIAMNYGLTDQNIHEIHKIIRHHYAHITQYWNEHFSR